MSNFQVFIGVCVGLACLVGKSDATVTFTTQPTTAKVNNNAASTDIVATVLGVATSTPITHSITGVTNSGTTYFDIDGTTGVITVTAAGATALASAATGDTFAITVSGIDGDSTAVTHIITISVNLIPVFTGAPFSFPVDDTTAAGDSVGTVTITDGDAGDSHTFAIATGNTNSDFDINTNAKVGTIVVATGKTLSKATTASYVLEVTTTDSTATVTASVTIAFSGGASALVPMLLMMMMCWLFYYV